MNIILKQLWLSKSVTLERELLPPTYEQWRLDQYFSLLHEFEIKFSHFH